MENGHESSESLRQSGNVLYKAGKLCEAIECYKKASEAAPSDATPLSNLSAAYFEMGNYDDCVTLCDKALDLPSSSETNLRQKLSVRRVKACIHLQRFDAARSSLKAIRNDPTYESLQGQLRYSKANWAGVDEHEARKKVINVLPRYKPTMQDVPEYYPVGHDEARSVFRFSKKARSKLTEFLGSSAEGLSDTADTTPPEASEKISYFFGGIGDARNFYATLTALASYEWSQGSKSKTLYHFTLNDLKPATIARILVVLMLFQDCANNATPNGNSPQKLDPKLEDITTLYFVYNAQIMPPFVYDRLQSTIQRAINNISDLPSWLRLSAKDRPQLLHSLILWRDETAQVYNTKRTRQILARHHAAVASGMKGPIESEPLAGTDGDRSLFEYFGFLLPPKEIIRVHEPNLFSHMVAITRVNEANKALSQTLSRYLDQHWKPNVTIVDLDYDRAKDHNEPVDIAFDPFSVVPQYQLAKDVKNPKSLFDYAAPTLEAITMAIHQLKDRMKVECIVGEVLEQVRYGLLDMADGTIDSVTTPAVPTYYDCVHLSNIPDYIGGTLSQNLYAIPLLRPSKEAYVTSCNLRNPIAFPSMRAFDYEYTLLHDAQDVFKVFHVQDDSTVGMPLMMMNYVTWTRKIPTGSPYMNLMDRAKTETWLYALFFKIAIPMDRPTRSWELVYSPLNLTAFFRVLDHLYHIGYPAHWLSTVLSNILDDEVTTAARPPRSCPMNLKEAEFLLPRRKQTMAPFFAEMITLCTVWARCLSFGLITQGLPDLSQIREYTITFTEMQAEMGASPVFSLLFWDAGIIVFPKGRGGMRQFLLDDEKSERSDIAERMRKKGMVSVTTLKWVTKDKQASFWMVEGEVEAMQRGRWVCGLWRTDDWNPASMPVSAKQIVNTGGTWMESKTKQMMQANCRN